MRARLRIPANQYIWEPAIVVMPHAGDLELDVTNEDSTFHIAFVPSDGDRQVLDLPQHTRGLVARAPRPAGALLVRLSRLARSGAR